uniref:Uncharacterized protein n=1 Tax=Oryza glumipatula TaxID=40148 RepID=A0A0D9ZL01_9ORYZ
MGGIRKIIRPNLQHQRIGTLFYTYTSFQNAHLNKNLVLHFTSKAPLEKMINGHLGPNSD